MRVMDTLFIEKESGLDIVPDQILVKIRQGQFEHFVTRVSVIGLRILKRMNLLAGDFVIVKTSPKPIHGVLSLLGDLPEVEYAEPNYTTRNSAFKTRSTHVSDLTKPWQKFSTIQAAIDVIDSKIDMELPRIDSEIQVNRQKIGKSKSNDFVDVNIKDLLFLSDAIPLNLAEAVEVIDYATKMEVDVVSNSWVRDGFSKALDDAIKVAEKKGISFVAAASIAASIGSGGIPEYIHQEVRPSSNVSAGVLSLYMAQEAKEGRSGRGRLIAKAIPSLEQIKSEWHSGSMDESSGKLLFKNDINVSQNYSFPGAKFIKLEIAKLNSTSNLGLIKVKNAKGLVIQNISTNSEFYETDYIETNLIVVEFHSNAASTSIGSVIRNVRVIY